MLMLGRLYSFFGTQEGDFSLTLRSIEAVTVDQKEGNGDASATNGNGKGEDADSESSFDSRGSISKRSGHGGMGSRQKPRQSWLPWLWKNCWKS